MQISFFLFHESPTYPVDAPVHDHRADGCINITVPFISPRLKIKRQKRQPEYREQDRHSLPAGEVRALFKGHPLYWFRFPLKPFGEYENSQDYRNND